MDRIRVSIIIIFSALGPLTACSGEQQLACEDDPRWLTRWEQCDGYLHNATAAQWRRASEPNRLKTSGDFVAALMTPAQVRAETGGEVGELLGRASAFERCISSSVDDEALDDVAISEIAATCAVMLGYSDR